jgi:hypothetical protein
MSVLSPAGREGIWGLIVSPAIWAVYFLFTYVTGAIWCARYAPVSGDLGTARLLIALYTVVALVMIALNARHALRRHRYGEDAGPPHDGATPEDRHRFLGFASLLLSGLAAIATIFVAMPLWLTAACH